MRALLQRVSSASVTVNGALVAEIGPGLLVLLGVGHGDTTAEALQLAGKVVHLRIFGDQSGKFNLSLLDIRGAALVVSQFTLYGDTSKGRRPSFVAAAAPDLAAPLVEAFAAALLSMGITVASGVFGAHMQVSLLNDGPVTLLLDTAKL